MLGGFVYGGELSFHETTSTIKWADVAGLVVYSSEEDYFIDTLGFTHIQYTELKNAVEYQHAQAYYADEGDFAHMQISLAARLAYKLGRTGILSNVYGGNETVSYLAGWLGDATLTNNGTTYFGNDDYIADLDAENIFRLLLNGNSITAASTTYFSNLSSSTRAQIFKNHISYTTAKSMIYYQLIDKVLYAQIDLAAAEGDLITVTYLQSLLEDVEYHEAQIANNYPDTHDFLLSLYSGLNEMGDY